MNETRKALTALLLALILPWSALALSAADTRAMVAIKKGDADKLRQALDEGADVNAVNKAGQPLALYAVHYDCSDCLALLIARGARLNYVDEQGETLLHWAVHKDRPEIVRILLDKGVPVDATGGVNKKGEKVGGTALTFAARRGYLATTKVLVDYGANANHLDDLNGTPLARAKEGGHHALIKYFQDLGATDVQDEAEKNPLRKKNPRKPSPKKADGAPSSDSGSGSGGSGGGSAAAGPGAPQSGPNFGGLFGQAGGQPPVPVASRPARPVYEITAANVLGGPLSPLWSSFKARHPEMQLDDQGHQTNMASGVKMVRSSRIQVLPNPWAAELWDIAREEGYVAENPAAPFLAAPKGSAGAVAAAEERMRFAPVVPGAVYTADAGPTARSGGRP